MKKKKKGGILKALTIVLAVILLVNVGVLGYLWYQNNHIFVDGKAYEIHVQSLDLRQEDISFTHFDSLHSQLPECEILWNVPFQDGKKSSDIAELRISGLTQADIDVMKGYFTELRTVDASGCRDYAMLEALQAQLPDVEVQYSVFLGGKEYAPDTEELILYKGDYTPELLAENLVYLHSVSRMELHMPPMGAEEINALRECFPEIEITCTVEVLGQEYAPDTTELDLSAVTAEQVDQLIDQLALLPELSHVELVAADGSSVLEMADAARLMAAVPQAEFHYVFDFYGTRVCTTDSEVILKNVKIGDEGEETVRLALSLMQGGTRFVLDNCRMSNELLAQLREEYRDHAKLVWRVSFGKGSCLTDAEVIRCVYDLVDDNSHNLVYCEDVRFLDLGHDEYLDGADFIAGMPNLEVVILSGAPIRDLTPFSGCHKLRVLELANCSYITDLSPLASCEALKMLNISYTGVTDLSPLDGLELTHMCAKGMYRPMIAAEEQKRFVEAHPDCWSQFDKDEVPYGQGWRYTTENKPMEWYAEITKAFRYPDAPNNAGWYFSN